MNLKRILLFIFLTAGVLSSLAQSPDSLLNLSTKLPEKFYSKVDKKFSSINDKLTKKSLKYLAKFQRQERKLQEKLQKLNPENVLANANEKYNELAQKASSKSPPGEETWNSAGGGEYNPALDSLATSFSFLKQFSSISDKVKEPLSKLNELQSKLQQTEKIKEFIAERKNQLKEILSKYTKLPAALKKEYDKLTKISYYYFAQVKEIKETLKDPKKIEQKALAMLNKLPAFQKFMKENSQLASLFGIPANYSNSQSLQGLQTIGQVQQIINSRIGTGPNATQMLQQQMQAAQGELNKFKDKLSKLGGGSGDIEMPDFVPQNQKTKSFLKRLEYGTNLQMTRGTYNFPTTSDIGGSVGYRWKNKITLGVGASCKIGWGKDIQHIHLTSEGMGLRSFFEYKLKKSFYATGGLEYNYQQPFNSIAQLKTNAWQQSGLVGISKVIDIKSKVFKKTKLQMLWDFLSYSQSIKTQALKFRVGYNF